MTRAVVFIDRVLGAIPWVIVTIAFVLEPGALLRLAFVVVLVSIPVACLCVLAFAIALLLVLRD